ncbi:MAG: hypothetical protein Greene041662_55 [Candidatus Peregrinibacteria bacterium Greene0416_62]|nr:MAG: hypothetical protein Greene041662_55 [Candidatus Peregrinibacteria bacterium Greene0416_62]TSC98381.1 MAG: hypothetical protein Greene101449_947 [Candidatus Peregrinibacteria bacterium Greene1014_49]
MEQYSSFIFDSYAFYHEEGLIELKYSLDDSIRFIETIKLPEPFPPQAKNPNFNRLLFLLHLIGGISYYKTCLPKKIEVRSGSLSADDATFWTQVYENGLGEFFYKNKIDHRGRVKFPCETAQRAVSTEPHQPVPSGKILVPFGGGKDSIITAEMLKAAGHDVTLLRIGHHPLISAFAKKAGFPLITIERRLDPILFSLNAEGALNGHVPITAYLSILSVIVAELYGFSGAVWSNERSANEGNTKLHDLEVNHQWSKGFAFEKALQEMLKDKTSVQYFSLLRPWSELRIVQECCKYPQYFASFTSCNANWKIAAKSEKLGTGLWCRKCPKCAFAFALFASFLPRATLEKIFGGNLFNSPALETTFRELLGLQGFKPFECVGTPDEVRAAFLLARKRGDLAETAMMKIFEADVLPHIKNPDALIERELAANDDHAIPKEFQGVLPK